MKSRTLIAGTLIALLNALALAPIFLEYARYLIAGSLLIAAWMTLKTFVEKERSAKPEIEVKAKRPPVLKSVAEAEVVAVLGALQSKGRFIDFVMDDVSRYSDAQVGAAARVVHSGCKAALSELADIEPIAREAEGSIVTVPSNAGDAYRVSGTVTGEGPHSGKLAHKGWRAAKLRLPRVLAEDGGLPPIAAAQVEIV